MNADEEGINQLSERVIGCAFRVSNALGAGFLEKVYENTLAYELRNAGVAVSQQHGMAVKYQGIVVGEYAVDTLVENRLMVELKAVKALDDVHSAQCLNYLKALGLHLCLLINFGKPRIDVKRIALGL